MRKVINVLGIIGIFYFVSEFGSGNFYIDTSHGLSPLLLFSAVMYLITYSVEMLMHKAVYLTELLVDSNMKILHIGILFELIVLPIVMYLFSANCMDISINGVFTYILMGIVMVVWQYICLDENPYRYLEEV